MRGVKRILSKDPGRKRGTEEHRHFEMWDVEQPEDQKIPNLPEHDAVSPTGEKGDQIIPPVENTGTATPVQGNGGDIGKRPGLFYVTDSAHLSQSDFGVLFPRVVKKATGHEEILDINVAETVKWLKEKCGVEGVEVPEVEVDEGRWKEIEVGEEAS